MDEVKRAPAAGLPPAHPRVLQAYHTGLQAMQDVPLGAMRHQGAAIVGGHP